MRMKFSARGRSQMSSAWVWTSMNPGASVRPRRVENVLRRGPIDVADRDDPPAPDRDVRTPPWRRRMPSTTRRSGDHQVVLRRL